MSNLILGYCGASWWAGNIISSKYWGQFSKNNSNFYMLKITTLIITILPLPWILIYYLPITIQIYTTLFLSFSAGIIFAGFSLSTFNLVYEIVDKNDVVKFTSILRFSESIGILISSITAGYIVDSILVNQFLINVYFTPIQLSITISLVLRILSLIFLYRNEHLFIKTAN